MSPKRIKCRRGNSKQSIAGALAECVLPEDMMLCILTRLPVKTIHRFKSVCKPWHKAFSSPEFRKLHRAQFSQNPENQSIVIHGRAAGLGHMSLLHKIDSDEKKKPTKLDIPYPQITCAAEFVGCCNGLFCAASERGGRLIVLWNPALNTISKLLPLPDLGFGVRGLVSIGFGYNEEADDFTVVRIFSLEKEKYTCVGVEVYSANSDSWTKMKPGIKFTVLQTKNEAIVNGSPYWVAMVDKKKVLVCFDVKEMVFKIVPLPDIVFEEVDDFLFFDLKGRLGALMCNKKNKARVLSLDFWVFDDVGKTGWTKNHSFGTMELKGGRFMQCLKNGTILVGEEGKVFVFDTENGGVKEIVIDEVQKGLSKKNGFTFKIYGYTESLAYTKGMENPW